MNSRDLINNKIVKQIRKTPIIVSILALLVMVYDIGYAPPSNSSNLFQKLYFLTLLIGASSTIARYVEKETRPRLITIPFDIALFTLLSTLIFQYITIYLSSSPTLLLHPYWIYLAIVLIFIREFSALKVSFKKTTFNPAKFFITHYFRCYFVATSKCNTQSDYASRRAIYFYKCCLCYRTDCCRYWHFFHTIRTNHYLAINSGGWNRNHDFYQLF